jgi:signal peptidase II
LKKAFYNKLWLLALIGADILSKALVLRWIPPMQGYRYPFGGIGVFDVFDISFSLNTVANTGAAWGVFPGHFSLLLALRVCVVAGIMIYLLFFRPASRPHFSLWLIVTGAIGNIIDMFSYGHVIDFIHLRFFGWSFPIFNIADSCITTGVVLLLLWPNRLKAAKEDNQIKVSDAS